MDVWIINLANTSESSKNVKRHNLLMRFVHQLRVRVEEQAVPVWFKGHDSRQIRNACGWWTGYCRRVIPISKLSRLGFCSYSPHESPYLVMASVICHLSSVNCQLSTVNCQLSTVRKQACKDLSLKHTPAYTLILAHKWIPLHEN